MSLSSLATLSLRIASVTFALGVLGVLVVHAATASGCTSTVAAPSATTAPPQGEAPRSQAPEVAPPPAPPEAPATANAKPGDHASPGPQGHECRPRYLAATKAGPVLPPHCFPEPPPPASDKSGNMSEPPVP